MNKRAITLGLLVLLLAIQWPLWFGKGGWLRVRELERDLNSQNAVNEELRLRNQKLRSEVASLRDGVEAIEERARYDLGMVGNDEVYVQIVSPVIGSDALSPTSSANSPTPQPAAAKPAGAGGSNNTGNKPAR